jgi:hypothetical protein
MLSFSYANSSINFIPASEIKNLTQAITTIKTHTQQEVPFPTQVPQSTKTLYAVQSSYDKPNYKEYWVIHITTDSKCLTKECVVGALSASSTDKLDFEYIEAPFDQNKKPIPKEKINLKPSIIAYYTPGHAEADWHPPTLEWQQNGMLYCLSWNLDIHAKQVFLKMLKSTTL